MICPLYQHAMDHPNDPYIGYPDRIITYGDLNRYVNQCIEKLKDHPKDIPFAIVGSDPTNVLSWLFAAARSHRIIAITSTKDPFDVRDHHLRSLAIDPKSQNWTLPEPGDLSDLHSTISAPNAPLCILFTSGSSGTPKAVVHSFQTLWSSAQFSQTNIAFQSGDRWLLSLSLWHIGGLMIPIRALFGGASVVVKTGSLGDHIEQDGITHISVVSTQLNDLLLESRVLDSLKVVLIGGGAIPHTLVDRAFQQNIPIHTTYGMTELCSQLCTTPSNASIDMLRSAGLPLGDWIIKISEQSEICVQGSPLFLGYWRGDYLEDPRDPDGFFHTGDTGKIEDGRLYPIGRVDQMFISGGENIHPEEIEKILGSFVRTVIVVPVPNDRYGQRPIAFIDPPMITEDQMNSMTKALDNALPKFKHPDHLLPWPSEITTHKPPRAILQQIAERWLIEQRSL